MGGSHRVAIETGQELPRLSWDQELTGLTDAWPYLCPVFLAATEQAMPEARPFHTVAHRGRGEFALLPGYVLEKPPAVDHDPRTYLGWQPPTGDEVCCGVDLPCGQAAEAGALREDAFFPTLLIGSPLGYRTEAAYNFWTASLFADMTASMVRAAAGAGIRSIAAPWIPDRSGNDALVAALVSHGGHAAFWGYEDYVPLRAQSWEAHLASLPVKMRQRVTGDQRRVAAAGIAIERADGDQIRPHVARIAELTCLNRQRNGAGQEPAQIAAMLTSLLGAHAGVRAYLGVAAGRIVGSCVVLRKGDRLFPKWAGFDYERLGGRSGLYFAMVLNGPVRDALAEGLRVVEFGAGAHQAKRLRGCSSRAITTALLVADPALRPTSYRLHGEFGRARHVAFGDGPVAGPATATAGHHQAACCSGG
jgi:uncharacterized protein